MAKRAMLANERTEILALKAALNASKDGLKEAILRADNLMEIAKAAGVAKEYNAAYRAKETFRVCLGNIGVAHAEASNAMDTYLEADPEILSPGGGRK